MTPRPRRRAVFALRGGIRREVRSILFGGARRRRIARAVLMALLLAGIVVAVALAGDHAGQVPAGAASGWTEWPPRAVATAALPPPEDDGQHAEPAIDEPRYPRVVYRDSQALGLHYAGGRLRRGVQLPAEGRDHFTWDPVLRRKPNRGWRRWGTDSLVRTTLTVLREFRAAHPDAPRVGVGDLSRPRGGEFGRRFGGLGHASHQNGLDVDVYYPRVDRLERRPHEPKLVHRRLAQDLVDRFVDAGAVKVFVGPRLRLHGPRGVVVPLVNHDDHLHVRLARPPE